MSVPEQDWISCGPHEDGTPGALFHFDVSHPKALEFAKQCFRVDCMDPSVVKDYEKLRANEDLLEAHFEHWDVDLILQTIQNQDPSWFVFEINSKDAQHRKWVVLSYEISLWRLLRDAKLGEKALIIVTMARVREFQHRIKIAGQRLED